MVVAYLDDIFQWRELGVGSVIRTSSHVASAAMPNAVAAVVSIAIVKQTEVNESVTLVTFCDTALSATQETDVTHRNPWLQCRKHTKSQWKLVGDVSGW